MLTSYGARAHFSMLQLLSLMPDEFTFSHQHKETHILHVYKIYSTFSKALAKQIQHQKPWPANNLKKYKINIFQKIETSWKTQDMSQNKMSIWNCNILTLLQSQHQTEWFTKQTKFSKMSLFFRICFILYEFNTLYLFGYHDASHCMMLYDVEQSLISIKYLMQHRSTFLLFSYVNNKVAFILLCTSTLLHLHTCSKSSLRQGQPVVWPKIWDHYLSQITNLHNSSLHHTTHCICFTMQSNTIQQSWVEQC